MEALSKWELLLFALTKVKMTGRVLSGRFDQPFPPLYVGLFNAVPIWRGFDKGYSDYHSSQNEEEIITIV